MKCDMCGEHANSKVGEIAVCFDCRQRYIGDPDREQIKRSLERLIVSLEKVSNTTASVVDWIARLRKRVDVLSSIGKDEKDGTILETPAESRKAPRKGKLVVKKFR